MPNGQDYFFFGDLSRYRTRLGLSKAGLAEILGVSVYTLYRWEGWGMLTKLTPRNEAAVAQFIKAAQAALMEFPDFADKFMTFAQAAQYRGVTNEYLLQLYREDSLFFDEVEDFGELGLFVRR
jgi:transcriptional regulator with XRE-family HTH domain